MFVVLALTQMLGVGTTDAGLARGGAQGSRARAARVQPVAGARPCVPASSFLASAWPALAATRLSADAPTRARRWPATYLLWFIPALALQFADGGDGRGAARHRQFQARA